MTKLNVNMKPKKANLKFKHKKEREIHTQEFESFVLTNQTLKLLGTRATLKTIQQLYNQRTTCR